MSGDIVSIKYKKLLREQKQTHPRIIPYKLLLNGVRIWGS